MSDSAFAGLAVGEQFMGDFSRQLMAVNRASHPGRSTDDEVDIELENELAPRRGYDDKLTREEKLQDMVERMCDWDRSEDSIPESGFYLWPLVHEHVRTTDTRKSRVMLAILEHMLVNGVMQCPPSTLTTWGVPRFQQQLSSFEEFQPRLQKLFDGPRSAASRQISVAIWLATTLRTDPQYATLVDRLASVFPIPVPTAADHSETDDDTPVPKLRKASADAPADVEKTQVTGHTYTNPCRAVILTHCCREVFFVSSSRVPRVFRSKRMLLISFLPRRRQLRPPPMLSSRPR